MIIVYVVLILLWISIYYDTNKALLSVKRVVICSNI